MEAKMDGEVKADVEQAEVNTEPAKTETKELSFREELEKNLKTEPETDKGEKKEPIKASESELVKKEPEAKKEVAAPIVPPADMSPEEKAVFLKASPEIQSYVSRRAYENRAALSREFQKIQERARSVEGLEKAIEPHREYLNKMGIQPDIALNRAIAWDQAMQRDRVQGAREWLASYGVDPFELIDENGQPQQPQVQQVDPEEIKRAAIEEVEKRFQMQEQGRATEEYFNTVNSFIKDKVIFRDPNTASMLESLMADEIPVIRKQNPGLNAGQLLQNAYDKVIKTNPTFSNLVQSFDAKEVAEKAKQEAEKAKQSSRSITGGIAGSTPVKGGLGFREELRLRMSGGL